MSSRVRECIKRVENHPDKESLFAFLEQSMQMHRRYADIKLMLEYYMFYETVSEGINPYLDSVRDMVESLNEKIADFYEGEVGKSRRETMGEELLSLRGEVIDRMKVLTAYVDRFVVYEYILNRVQYRFEDQELLPDDNVFAQDLMNFILSDNDSAVLNDKIRFALGQLPVRISRTKYFEWIRNSISVYQGSDRSALEGFLYMFRTSAMLYHDENEDRYFTEFRALLEELENLDFDHISYELYQIYSGKIRMQASKLNDISDLYLQLGQLINEMYILCITDAFPNEEKLSGDVVIRGVLALFSDQDNGIWQEEGMTGLSEEEKLSRLGESFLEIEGKQEACFETLGRMESTLDHLLDGKRQILEESGLEEDFVKLKRLFLLISSSVFADLEEKELQETVTEKMADQVSAQLITECKAFFEGKSKLLRRAVMANTLEKMPVFFKNAQQIADYIVDALGNCDDEAEKYASKQLLLEMMCGD